MESEIQMAIVQVAWATVEFYELLVRRLSKQSSMPKSSPFQNFWKHQEKEKDKKDSSRSHRQGGMGPEGRDHSLAQSAGKPGPW